MSENPAPQPAPETQPAEPSTADAPAARKWRLGTLPSFLLFGAICAAVVAVALGVTFDWFGGPNVLEEAYDRCMLTSTPGVRVADEGRTLVIDTQGEDEVLGVTLRL